MDRRQFLSSTGAATALTLAPAALKAASPAGDVALNALFEAIFQENLDDSPETVTQLGIDSGKRAAAKAQLGDRSLAARAADLARTKKAIARIEAVDATGLSDAGRLNREVVL